MSRTARRPLRTPVFAFALALLAAPASAQQAVAPAPLPEPGTVRPGALAQPDFARVLPAQQVGVRGADPGESQLFHVTLVAAGRQGSGGGQGTLPKAVAQALDDIKDFLPYQSYRVVDSALVRASGEARTGLKGPDGTPFEASIHFRSEKDGDGPRSFLVEHFELRKPLRVEALARDLESVRGGRAAVAPMAGQPTLRASFRIDEGETVVVGSSRLDGGDEALIVLLTAVP